MPALTAKEDELLATTPTEELLKLPLLQPENIKDTLHANGPRGDFYKNMFAKCPAGRPGTADEVANVADCIFLYSGQLVFVCDVPEKSWYAQAVSDTGISCCGCDCRRDDSTEK
jgi:hypothetical protein